MTGPHPLRRAMLRRACHADIESEERDVLIRQAVPRLDREYVLAALLQARQDHDAIHPTDAEATFTRLVDEDRATTPGEVTT